jgi:hypothetical protein
MVATPPDRDCEHRAVRIWPMSTQIRFPPLPGMRPAPSWPMTPGWVAGCAAHRDGALSWPPSRCPRPGGRMALAQSPPPAARAPAQRRLPASKSPADAQYGSDPGGPSRPALEPQPVATCRQAKMICSTGIAHPCRSGQGEDAGGSQSMHSRGTKRTFRRKARELPRLPSPQIAGETGGAWAGWRCSTWFRPVAGGAAIAHADRRVPAWRESP